ncbi:MAG: 4-(cytidine 5'-diphospho)-2-C-methyl-D-erythritol kinase [Planctomycetota bacterium]|jgi:4-diphosphocytidyl-2-C-methyl-D-erythritol kinase
MADSIAVQAPAKLNLALSVGPPDDDGMHPICTWMVTVDLCDELLVTRLAADRFSRYAILWHPEARRRGDIDWSTTRDLAVRAHLALEQHVNRRLPVQMKLEKRIPVGGGLGGGSSDAAAMLRATDELFELGLTDDELRAIAAGLGSDVPFFVRGGSAIVEGFGERIAPHDEIRPLHAVIVFPEATCPTGHVYAMYDEIGPQPLRPDAVRALAAGAGALRTEAVFNDLAAAALRLTPQLKEPAGQLSRLAECPAQVAGSGSSLFVLCDDQMHATHFADAVTQRLDLPAVAVRSAPVPEPTTIASP